MSLRDSEEHAMHLLPEDIPAFVSVQQFMALVGVSRGLAYRLIRTGAIRAVRLGKRGAIRISRAELERFLRDRALKAITRQEVTPTS